MERYNSSVQSLPFWFNNTWLSDSGKTVGGAGLQELLLLHAEWCMFWFSPIDPECIQVVCSNHNCCLQALPKPIMIGCACGSLWMDTSQNLSEFHHAVRGVDDWSQHDIMLVDVHEICWQHPTVKHLNSFLLNKTYLSANCTSENTMWTSLTDFSCRFILQCILYHNRIAAQT